MEPIANETWKSFRRSRYRRRVLIVLSSLGEAYVGQLSRMIPLRPDRVKMILVGGSSYARDLSLVGLGLAVERPTSRGRAFEITAKGRRKARSMLAAQERHTPRAASRARAVPAPPEPATTATVSWSTVWG